MMCALPVCIATDGTCDLPAETIARHGVCVVPLFINVGEQGFPDG
jgi:fatty acid-binding protein DegV